MSEPVDEFLAHYGIPGMKWGRRKATSSPNKGKSIEDRFNRVEQERKLKKLINEDLHPKRTATLKFLNDSKGPLFALGAATVTLASISYAAKQAGAAEAGKILAESRGLPVAKTFQLIYDAKNGVWR